MGTLVGLLGRTSTLGIAKAAMDPLQEAMGNATANPALGVAARNATASLGLKMRDPLQEAMGNATANPALGVAARNATASLGLKMRDPLHEAMRPYLLESSWTDLKKALSTNYGAGIAEYAEAVGRSVVERTDVDDLERGSEDEGSVENPFIPLSLSEAEIRALAVLFGLVITSIAVGGSAIERGGFPGTEHVGAIRDVVPGCQRSKVQAVAS